MPGGFTSALEREACRGRIFLLAIVAFSWAASLAPAALGLYRTVTVHDFPLARLSAEQPSAVFVNAAEPVSEIVRAPVACAPEFVSVNVLDAVAATASVPKS